MMGGEMWRYEQMLNFMGKILEVRLTGKLKYATTSS
jgi:hypothetical protein